MKSKNYLILCFAIFVSFGSYSQSQPSGSAKATVLEKMHWLIERSDMNTVRTQFDKICAENSLPSIVSGLKDGTYKGSTPVDDFGYRHEVVFEMKKGKMISIDYDEIHTDGHAKQGDAEYGKQMLESGTTPAIAYPKYESQMLERQDYNQVDAVTGASYSLYRLKLSILYAMLNSGQL
ncbi:MAG: hypothetical protein H7X84_07550 [Verrucomicrobia bacterium]|nr:hypothetical protein [Prolixibacteraceae bacterium]